MHLTMADWKQITARIRRARGSRDPAGQLTLLYEKTGDAMVAFELGRHFEIAKDPPQALHWYLASAAKFRRGDWKTKARDAVLRLGADRPPDIDLDPSPTNGAAGEPAFPAPAILIPEPAVPFEQTATAFESLVAAGAENPPSPESADHQVASPAADPDKRHRRRGRRGGRNRRKPSPVQTSPAHAPSETRGSARPSTRSRAALPAVEAEEPVEILPPRTVDSRAIPRIPVEQIPESAAPSVKGRFGDPGLRSERDTQTVAGFYIEVGSHVVVSQNKNTGAGRRVRGVFEFCGRTGEQAAELHLEQGQARSQTGITETPFHAGSGGFRNLFDGNARDGSAIHRARRKNFDWLLSLDSGQGRARTRGGSGGTARFSWSVRGGCLYGRRFAAIAAATASATAMPLIGVGSGRANLVVRGFRRRWILRACSD